MFTIRTTNPRQANLSPSTIIVYESNCQSVSINDQSTCLVFIVFSSIAIYVCLSLSVSLSLSLCLSISLCLCLSHGLSFARALSLSVPPHSRFLSLSFSLSVSPSLFVSSPLPPFSLLRQSRDPSAT